MNNRNLLPIIGSVAGLLGLLLICVAVGYALIAGGTGGLEVPRNLLLGALVLLLVFTWLNPELIARVITGRGTRYGANAFLRILVGIGIAMLLYAIWGLLGPRIGGGFGRIDVTASKQFTLSPLTEQTLRNLPGPVTVVAFFTPSAAGRADAENVLKEYSARTDKLKVQFVDPIQDPLTAGKYNLTHTGVVVFDNGSRREQAASNTEQDFTAALLRLRETGVKTIAVLDVPSVVDFTGSGSQQLLPMSLVQAELTNQNYQWIAAYNLTISPTITVSSVTVLIVPPAPSNAPLSDQAVRAVSDYLDRGGHVLLMGDPQAAPLPAALLQKYGLTEYHEVVMENNQQNLWARPGTALQQFNIIVTNYAGATITKDMNGRRTFYSVAEAIQLPTSTITGFVTTPIVQSGSGASLAKIVTSSGGVSLQPDTSAPPGPYNLMIGVDAQPPASPVTTTQQTTQTHRTRLVVLGDADMARDDFIQSYQFVNNRDLFVNTVNWLAQSEDRISIPPRTTTTPTLTLDAAQSNVIFYTSVLFMPVLVLVLGGVIWWRRR